MGRSGKIVFKQYAQNKIELLPASYEEIIPEGHLVRLVNIAIDQMELEGIISDYKGGGTSSYHPKMLLKVIIYSYTQRIYSSRQIAKALRENIYFRWLSGSNDPDFRTINRFRSSRLKKQIKQVFAQMIKILHELGVVSLDNYFLDGTKIEANANKYSFVWRKAVEKNKVKLEERIKEILDHADRINEEENKKYGDKDLEEMGEGVKIDSKKIEEIVKDINEKIKEITNDPEYKRKEEEKELQRKKKKIQKDYLERMKRYENQQEIFKGRNSYSKTDPDATFMRMKEDHMRNGQLKAAYNVQMGTENQFILGYSIHQRPTDTGTLIAHLEEIKRSIAIKPKRIIADAGYGSQENYAYLEKQDIEAYVKYNSFDKEQKKRYKPDEFKSENMEYNDPEDEFICANNRILEYHHTENYMTENGYQTERRVYRSRDCTGCQLKDSCYKGAYSKQIKVSHELMGYRKQARQRLESQTGVELRKQRFIDTEPVFGQLKYNRGFKRFSMRGMDKVHLEFGLHSLAHNLLKLHRQQNTAKLSISR
jgi:transposase